MTPAMSGLAYGALAIGLCVGAPIWGRWFEKMQDARSARWLEVICAVCALLVTLQALAREPWLIAVFRFAWGFGLGGLLPVFYALISRGAGARQGAALAAGNAAAKAGALVGTAAGAFVMGLVPARDLFWPVVAAYVIAALGLAMLRPRPPVLSSMME